MTTRPTIICGTCGGKHAYHECPILARAIADAPSIAAEAEYRLRNKTIIAPGGELQ